MKYSYSLHEEAFDEFTQALARYKERGQSTHFRSQIKHAIEAIRNNPFAWQKVEKDDRFRRYVVQKFPFKVVYAVQEERQHVFIIAVASTYRQEGYWEERVE